jgi:hypothetical protein
MPASFSCSAIFVSEICVLQFSSFRDRRYEYKGLNKVWKGKLGDAKASGNPINIQEASVSIKQINQ